MWIVECSKEEDAPSSKQTTGEPFLNCTHGCNYSFFFCIFLPLAVKTVFLAEELPGALLLPLAPPAPLLPAEDGGEVMAEVVVSGCEGMTILSPDWTSGGGGGGTTTAAG